MAYQRISDGAIPTSIKADSLDSFVNTLAQIYNNQQTIRNAEDELKFNETVLAGNLSLDDQLQYRKDQLKRVSDDPTERKRIRGEIASLKDRIEQDTFTKNYTAKLTDFQAGVASIDSVIQFLKDTKAATTDINVQNTIDAKLADAQAKKFSLTQELVKNNTEYATTSRSVDVIDTQIGKVNSYRATALLAGNDQLVSVYDLQLQALKSAKTQANVTQNILSLGAVSATGAFTSVAMLDALNDHIANADTGGPVTVNGTQYANEKDFWTFKRDSYLTDQSSNGFFPSLNAEVKDDINTANSKNTLDGGSLNNLTKVFDTIASRPELANFDKQLTIYRQDAFQTGANAIAQTVANEFARTLDVTKAVKQLDALKALGANVDTAYTQILSSNAATKNSQVGGILQAAQNAMANDPSLTPEQAVQQAVASGAGTVVSPTEAATKTEQQIASEAVGTSVAGKGVVDPRTTLSLAPTEPANTPQGSGNINFASIAALPNLTPGMSGDSVKTLQNFLIQQGFNIPSGATGYYGDQTKAAVAAYQQKNNIDAAGNPGYFGPRTKTYLSGLGSTTPAPAPAPQPQVSAPVKPITTQPKTTPAPAPSPTVTPAPASPTSTQKQLFSFTAANGQTIKVRATDSTAARKLAMEVAQSDYKTTLK